MSDQCCPGDPECRRKQPILLRPAPFEPGRYYLLTRYSRRPQSDGSDVIRSSEKHALGAGVDLSRATRARQVSRCRTATAGREGGAGRRCGYRGVLRATGWRVIAERKPHPVGAKAEFRVTVEAVPEVSLSERTDR